MRKTEFFLAITDAMRELISSPFTLWVFLVMIPLAFAETLAVIYLFEGFFN